MRVLPSLVRHTEIPHETELRAQVRAFLASDPFESRCDAWLYGFDPEFSKRLAKAGFVGMTLPQTYGGGGRTALERYVVVEELLAAGAPVAAHWIADRQSAPLLMRFGTEEQRERMLPAITRGELYFAIGMSEPDAGSDLAAIRTMARRVDGGWSVSGSKVWTSNAHRADYMITLCRTSPKTESRHEGMSQLIVDLKAPGVDVRPIKLLTGSAHFSEVFLDDVIVPDSMVVGTVGRGWNQVLSELAFERSGPERLLSTFPLLAELAEVIDRQDRHAVTEVGRLVANLSSLRRLASSVAGALDAGEEPAIEAALVKDVSTRHEQHITETARLLVATQPRLSGGTRYERLLAQAVLAGPGFTLRGGTNEILRGIVARGLELR